MTTLQQYRNKILNTAFVVLAVSLLMILFYNFSSHPKPPISYINYFITVAFIIDTICIIFKKRILYSIRSWILVICIYLLAQTDLFMLGFVDMGFDVIFVGVICGFIFLDSRNAIIFSAISLLTFLAVSLLNINYIITPVSSPEEIVNSTGFKMERLFKGIFYIIFISTCLFYLIRYFYQTTILLEKNNNKLNDSNNELIAEIEKRKKNEAALIESEEKFRNLYNHIKDVVMVADFDMNILEVNDAFVKITGISKEEALKMKPIEWFPQKYQKIMLQRMMQLKYEPVPSIEAEYYSKNLEQIIPVELSSKKITYNNIDAVLSIVRDLRNEKQNEKKVLNAIIDTEEKQRAYFASELHDGLVPLLSTIKLYLQWMGKPDVKADKKELLSKAEETLEQAYSSLKEISNNLSPHILQNFGLERAIHSFIEQLKLVTPIKFDIKWASENRLAPEKERAIYRILTECINNTLKHSDAKNVSVIFNTSLNIAYINYFDDGKGFNSDKVLSVNTGKGFYNIRTRLKSVGGTMNIESEPGQGVNLMFKVPITN